jgi:hypothetical protein
MGPTDVTGDEYVLKEPKSPWTRWLLASVFLLAAFLVTGDRLVSLGIMKQSLTSANEMTRAVAEVLLITCRVVSGLLGLVLLLLWSHLGAWFRTSRVHALMRPVPTQVAQVQMRVLNASGLALALMLIGSLWLVAVDTQPARLTREDGPYETFTALGFALAGVVGLSACLRRGWRFKVMPLLLMSLFFLLAAGEEISWGQRLMNFNTPKAIATYNVQGELNVHNMFGYLADHLFIAGTFVYGAVLPLACARLPALSGLCWRTGWPVASRGLALGFLALSLMHEVVLGQLGRAFTQIRTAEIREAAAALAYLLLMLEARAVAGSR